MEIWVVRYRVLGETKFLLGIFDSERRAQALYRKLWRKDPPVTEQSIYIKRGAMKDKPGLCRIDLVTQGRCRRKATVKMEMGFKTGDPLPLCEKCAKYIERTCVSKARRMA